MLDSLWTRLLTALERRSSPRPPSTPGCGPAASSALDGDHLRIAAPNRYTRDWLVQHHTETLQAAARDGARRQSARHHRGRSRAPAPARPRRSPRAARRASRVTACPPRYTFESFVVGNSNQFAQAACQAVAELPSQGLQPALHLRRGRPRQDPPAPRRRPPDRAAYPAPARPLPLVRALHQRADQRHPLRPHRGVPRQVPHHRPAPDRRHPVHLGQGADPGGVLPHLQRPLRGAEADRPDLRRGAQGDSRPRGAPALALRVGADRRHPAARLRDARGHPQEEGGDRARPARPTTSPISSRAASRPTSARSRARSPA